MKKTISLILTMTMFFLLAVPAMAADSDFTIQDGVLTKYNGSGGDVVVPDSVKEVGQYAFYNCITLTSVKLPDSVTAIGDYAFRGCNSLTKLNIPDTVTSIGNEAFAGCKRLANVTLPVNVVIPMAAFDGCTSFTGITIPEGVPRIVESAFRDCVNLTCIAIPSSVSLIGYQAFRGCTALTDVYYSGTEEQWNAIYKLGENEPLTSATIHYNSTAPAMPDAPGEFIVQDGVLTLYTGTGGRVVIPENVTTIKTDAFSFCAVVTDVIIPDSVTVIENSAFKSCFGLERVTIPGSVAAIGPETFEFCRALKSVTIFEGVKTVGSRSFNSCSSLTDITLPSSVTEIGDVAFANSALSNITFPDGVTSIADGAFSECTSLRSVTIPSSVTSLGMGVFKDCTSLTEVTISAGVKSMGNYVFQGCTSLNSIVIPDGIVRLGVGFFRNCTGLTSITIPTSVKDFYYEFDGCTALTDVYYAGTREQWEDIAKLGNSADILNRATIHYNSETEPSHQTSEPTVFSDVPADAYYAASVAWAVNHDPQITNGIGGGKFSPAGTVKRSEAVTFLWRAAGCPEPKNMTSAFSDVTNQNAWYYKAVLWATEQNITNGVGGGKFGLDGTLAYDQMITFMARAAGADASGADWSAKAMKWAADNGLTDGLTVTAKGNCPRCDVVYCLWKQMA